MYGKLTRRRNAHDDHSRSQQTGRCQCPDTAPLSSLFVLRSQLGQNLLIAGLPAGDSVKISAGIFADRHTLGSKCPADVAEVTLRKNAFFGKSVFPRERRHFRDAAEHSCGLV